MTTLPRTSVVALAVVFSIVAGGLLAVAVPSVANASTSSSLSSLISKLNSYRVSHSSKVAFARNTFIDMNAEEYARQYAKFGAASLPGFTPATDLPMDITASGPNSWSDFYTAVSGSNAVQKLASALESVGASTLTDSDNYFGVGFATRGSGSYAYVVTAHYNNPPLKRIVPGSASIPSTQRVGTEIFVKVHGFSPSGLTYSYVWETNGSVFGSSSPGASLQGGNFGQTVKVFVTAHRAGYADATVSSNVTKPILAGIPFAPKVLTITGHRNVGQTLSAPGENTEGWGPYFVNEYSYQWFANGKAIPLATNSTYSVQPGDYRKRIDLQMSLTGPNYLVSTRETHTHALIGHPLLAILGTPEIEGGNPTWGTSVRAEYDIFIETVRYSFRWSLAGHLVGTGFTYTPPESAVGKSLVVEVTGNLPGYAATSDTTGPVTVEKRSLTSSGDAEITGGSGAGGAAEYGDKLSTKFTHGFTPGATTYTYQWYLDSTPIPGATHSTEKVPLGVPALNVGVEVTAHRTGYLPAMFSVGIPIN